MVRFSLDSRIIVLIILLQLKKKNLFFLFSVESGMEILLAYRGTGERDTFLERIFSQKVCGAVGDSCRNVQFI